MNFTDVEHAVADYNSYKEPGLDLTRLTLFHILPKIEALKNNSALSVLQAGTSIEGRQIFRIKIGSGAVKVLLWSQMHGDEPTATKALFDLLNFFTDGKRHSSLRDELLSRLEIHLIPMLNPDGAERFTRENYLNIDLNRDAYSLECPEAQLLQKIKDEVKPEFCFNLHDQERYYSVSRTDITPALSFLAPPTDYFDTVNEARKRAMQLVVNLKSVMDKYIPGRLAKYSDEHEPRSFGDNFNRQGASVILIESGYLPGDSNKEKIREYNFTALLSAFYAIASGSYANADINLYFDIPGNEKRIFDLMLKGATLKRGGRDYKIDVGINRPDSFDTEQQAFYSKGSIKEVGDLSIFTAHEIIDCTGLFIAEGRISAEAIDSPDSLDEINRENLFMQGVTTLLCRNCSLTQEYVSKPFNIALSNTIKRHEIKAEMPANFSLNDKNGVRYLIVNGFPISLPFNKNLVRNSLIFR
jgi:hypothetical protein